MTRLKLAELTSGVGAVVWASATRGGPSGLSRYTRTVSSRQLVSAVVLVVLTALSISGSVCALVCDAAKTNATAGHHGSAKGCEGPAPSSADVQIRGVSEHDCSAHETSIRQASLTATDKANASVTSIPLANPVTISFTAALNGRAHFQNSSPPGTAPPTATPLVLRI